MKTSWTWRAWFLTKGYSAQLGWGGGVSDKKGWEPQTQTTLHDRMILIPSETSLSWTDVNVSNTFSSNATRRSSSVNVSSQMSHLQLR